MDSFEYIELVLHNLEIYVASILLGVFFYFIIFKKKIFGLLDPLFYFLVFSAIGFSTVLFLFLTRKIIIGQFVSYIFTQSAFFFGIITVHPNYRRSIYRVNFHNSPLTHQTLLYVFLIVFFAKLIVFGQTGIPLFESDRLRYLFNGGFLSTISIRVYNALNIFLIALLAVEMNIKSRKIHLLYLTIILVLTILDGSKSAFIGNLLIFSLVTFYYHRDGRTLNVLGNLILANPKLILGVTIFFTLIAMLFSTSNPIYLLIYRLGISGDSFYMTLPNNVLNNVVKADINPLIELIKGPLSWVNLYNGDLKPLGFKVMEYHTKVDGILKGPIIRHNTFGVLLFGTFLGGVYSYMIGFLIGRTRKMIFLKNYSHPVSLAIRVSLFFIVMSIASDYYNFLNSFIDFIFILIPLIVGIKIFGRRHDEFKI